MIKITVDCNRNVIVIEANKNRKILHVKYPQEICNVLCEVFNTLGDDFKTVSLYTQINKIDEDTESIVGEW
jgi:hypothetical protein